MAETGDKTEENRTTNENEKEPEQSSQSASVQTSSQSQNNPEYSGYYYHGQTGTVDPNTAYYAAYYGMTPEAYQQYCAQYYAQYAQYAQQQNIPVNPSSSYYNTSAVPTPTQGTLYESTRASRQLGHYFDPTQFKAALSPEELALQTSLKQQEQSKLTKKDIEAFKKRKEEKKKMKNKWLYE